MPGQAAFDLLFGAPAGLVNQQQGCLQGFAHAFGGELDCPVGEGWAGSGDLICARRSLSAGAHSRSWERRIRGSRQAFRDLPVTNTIIWCGDIARPRKISWSPTISA
jgi:hypothetical protein